MHFREIFVLLAGTGLAAPVSFAQCPIATFRAEGPAIDDEFGWSLAFDGNTVLAGAYRDSGYCGAVFVYERGDAGWQSAGVLRASDPRPGDYFGISVAVDGRRAFIGAHGRDEQGSRTGLAYCFERDGSGWHERTRIHAPDRKAGDQFGWAVALDGDTALVSAFARDGTQPDTGAVYVFDWNGVDWVSTAILEASDAEPSDRFGWSLAMDGDRAVVGTPLQGASGHHEDWGAAYVYERVSGVWGSEQKLVGNDSGYGDWLGFSVDVDGDRVVAGAPFASEQGEIRGATYVFDHDGSGFVQRARLVSEQDQKLQRFGHAVAVSGDHLTIGELGDPARLGETGRCNVFELRSTGWERAFVELPPENPPLGRFGRAVAMEGGLILASLFVERPLAPDWGEAVLFRVGAGENYCQASINSTGFAASMTTSGCGSAESDDLVLQAGPVPDDMGQFFFGPNAISIPFGDGTLCVGGGVHRLGSPTLASGNLLVHAVDYLVPPADRLLPGTSWNFQLLFRDPNAGGAGFGLSDALRILFVP